MEVYLRDLAEQGGAVTSKLDSTERLSAPTASPVRVPRGHIAGGVAITTSCMPSSFLRVRVRILAGFARLTLLTCRRNCSEACQVCSPYLPQW